MKVVALGSQIPPGSDGKVTWTNVHETATKIWPRAFTTFLENIGESLEVIHLDVDTHQNLVSVEHGSAGCKVVWTLEQPLPQSWRVAAFHSNIVAEINTFDPKNIARADGISCPGEHFNAPLAIQTADCLAVAMTTETRGKVDFASCFHAGWRGFTSGIQHNAIALFDAAAGIRAEDSFARTNLAVTISPAIQGQSYPCGEDVLIAFRDHHARMLEPLSSWSKEHDQAYWDIMELGGFEAQEKIFPDLQALMCLELHALGIPLGAVTVFRDNTLTSYHWPSHRRAIAQGLAHAGRLITHLCPPTCPSVTNHASTFER